MRTYVVVVWIACNAILAMAVSEAYGTTGVEDNIYLKFILWAVACLALFRAIGSSAFGVINIIQMIAEGKMKVGNKNGPKSTKSGSTGMSSWKGGKSVGGWSSKLSTPSWMSSTGSYISDRVSRYTPSSVGSAFGR